jgi:hypothetical protein
VTFPELRRRPAIGGPSHNVLCAEHYSPRMTSSTVAGRQTADGAGSAARHARPRPSNLRLLFEPAPRSGRSIQVIVLSYGAAFVALTLVSLLRQSGVSPTNTVWAEDGTIFYGQALAHPFLVTLFTPYAGYFQLFPRLTFGLLSILPPADIAASAAIVGAATLAGLALFVFHASRGLIPSATGRSLLVGTIVLLPLATGELLNNVVNVPWWLFFAAFWALLWRPRTLLGTIAAGIICFVSAGSDPLVGLFLPLALARLYVGSWKEGAAPLGLGLGLVYQVIGVLRADHQGAFASASAHGVFRIVGTRLGLGWIGGNRVTDYVVKSPSVFWPLLGVAVLLAVLVVAIVLRQRRILVFVITSLSFSILVLVVPVWVRGAGPTMVASPVAIGARYVATPILLIWGAVIAEATSVPITGRFGVRNLGVAFCCACLIPIWVIDFRTANERSGGPLWGNEVAQAQLACRSISTTTHDLKISPTGWFAVVPCSDIDSPPTPSHPLVR